MIKKKNMSMLLALCCSLTIVTSLQAMQQTSNNIEKFDIHGDGKEVPIRLPFSYYKRKPGDHLQIIHQGGYKVYDIATQKKEVAVIGYLHPCIGIAVTDGVKLITFHKFFKNSFDSMKDIIKLHLDLTDSSKLFARIYTTRDDKDWQAQNRNRTHGGHSHQDEVKKIKDMLCNDLGFIRANIPANLFNVLDKNNDSNFQVKDYVRFGRYDLAAMCVAIRLDELFQDKNGSKEIKFASIDPFTEDALGLANTKVRMEDGFVSYEELLEFRVEDGANRHNYVLQRDYCSECLQKEEDFLYKKHLGKTVNESYIEKMRSAIGVRISREQISKGNTDVTDAEYENFWSETGYDTEKFL